MTCRGILVGTSGWRDARWRDAFYPGNLDQTQWLAFYAERFACVELSECFHKLPEPDAIAQWCAQTPEHFRFTVRAPKGFTHQKKLKNCETELQMLLARLDVFGDRLGPIVFELPRGWRASPRRLAAFLERLPSGRRYAFELPERSWHRPDIYELLSAHGTAFCIFDRDGVTSPLETTAEFVYVRLHGPGAKGNAGYGAHRLRTWAGRALAWNKAGKDVYVLFDNADGAAATKNARRTQSCLREGAAHPGEPINIARVVSRR